MTVEIEDDFQLLSIAWKLGDIELFRLVIAGLAKNYRATMNYKHIQIPRIEGENVTYLSLISQLISEYWIPNRVRPKHPQHYHNSHVKTVSSAKSEPHFLVQELINSRRMRHDYLRFGQEIIIQSRIVASPSAGGYGYVGMGAFRNHEKSGMPFTLRWNVQCRRRRNSSKADGCRLSGF